MNDSAPTSARTEEPLDFSWSRRLPLVRQSEIAECGLACLAMVSGYHGSGSSLAELRRRFQPSPLGSNL